MKNIIKRTKRLNVLLLSVGFLITGLFIILIVRHATEDPVTVRTFRVAGGWGYELIAGERSFIYQPFIPTRKGKQSFPSRNSARKAGNLVKKKIVHGKPPALTREDLKELGLDDPGTSN